MPSADSFTGLSRKVIQYCNGFKALADKIRDRSVTEADWSVIEELVDVQSFRRMGVFLTDRIETSTWQQYRQLISQYGGMTVWEGRVRRITETPGLVFLELQERNTREGTTDVSNTLTIYEFNPQGKLCKLDVYVAHVEKRPA
jgi:hypothetical protein